YDPDGLDIDYLLNRRVSFGTVTTLFKNTLTNNELLEGECDISVHADDQNQITEVNANKIITSIIVEAASSPTTMEATKILNERGILLVPDLLASSGGVVVTYFEWVQNNQGYYWSEEKVANKLNNIMTNAFEKIYHASQIR